MYDWATVYMRDVVLATPALSSAAYAAFTGGMAAGRFGGDVVRARFGAPQLIFGERGAGVRRHGRRRCCCRTRS